MSTRRRQPQVQTALKLDGISKSEVLSLCQHYLNCMTDNPNFPDPFPSLDDIGIQFRIADKACREAMSRTIGTAGQADTEIRKLKNLLIGLSRYVEVTANFSGAMAEVVILSSGMDVKRVGRRPPRIFSVRQGPYPGSVKLDSKAEKDCYCVYEMSTDPELKEENWFRIYEGARVKFIKMGLESDKRYYFRGRLLTRDGPRPWSVVLSLLVT